MRILKAVSIGYEVPFFDKKDSNGITELVQSLSNQYRIWFDVVKTDLDILEMPNKNTLIVYTIVILVDKDLTNVDSLKEDWDKTIVEFKKSLEEFFKTRKTEFRIIEGAPHDIRL